MPSPVSAFVFPVVRRIAQESPFLCKSLHIFYLGGKLSMIPVGVGLEAGVLFTLALASLP